MWCEQWTFEAKESIIGFVQEDCDGVILQKLDECYGNISSRDYSGAELVYKDSFTIMKRFSRVYCNIVTEVINIFLTFESQPHE